MKLLHRQNVIHTLVQKEHIINLIQKLINEANIVIKIGKSEMKMIING